MPTDHREGAPGVGYGDIMRFATPVFIGNGINAVVGFLCRIIAGELGEKAFNSINVGLMIFFIVVTILTAISVGTTVLVAQYWGQGDRSRAGRVIQQSLTLGGIVSLLISVIGLVGSRPLFSVLGIDAETAKMGEQFLFWIFLFLPLATPGLFITAALRGAGDTRTPMWAGLILAALWLTGFYGLSLGKLGLPRLEVVGGSLALNFAFAVYTLIVMALVLTKRTVLTLPKGGWRPDLRWGAKIFKIGMPTAAEWLLIRVGMFVYIVVVAYYGEKALAGYFAGTGFLNLFYALTFGFQTAATTLVGQAVGAGDAKRARTALNRSTLLSFLFMTGTGVLLLFVSTDVLAGLFRELDIASITHARTFLVILALSMPFMGISFALAGGLRGAGNTVRPLVSSIVGLFGGRICLALALYYLFHPPIYIIWCSMVADILIRILILISRPVIAAGKITMGIKQTA